MIIILAEDAKHAVVKTIHKKYVFYGLWLHIPRSEIMRMIEAKESLHAVSAMDIRRGELTHRLVYSREADNDPEDDVMYGTYANILRIDTPMSVRRHN